MSIWGVGYVSSIEVNIGTSISYIYRGFRVLYEVLGFWLVGFRVFIRLDSWISDSWSCSSIGHMELWSRSPGYVEL